MKQTNEQGGVLNWCRRYIHPGFLVTAGLVIYIMFGTQNSVLNTYSYDREIERLKTEIALRNDTVRYYENLYHNLSTDPVTMERIVREKYHMQRPGEEVYVFTD